jgi:succinate dehydrogenase / fumarate reductase flavoprotein subunit
MKSTIAKWTKEGPQISYEDIDVSLIKPRKRDYSSDKKKGE